jgi:hypothetical protein
MVRKLTPGTTVAIQARLNYLRGRKNALDQLILCLERYSLYKHPKLSRIPRKRAESLIEADREAAAIFAKCRILAP